MTDRCWGCQIRPDEWRKCRDRSMGQTDRHHLLPQQTIKREFPHGAYDYEAGGELDPILRGHTLSIPPNAREIHGVRIVTQAELLADTRNLVVMGRWHHGMVENHRLNPTWDDLPLSAVVFATWLGLAHLLERRYPEGLAA